jgi:hypothetical protein
MHTDDDLVGMLKAMYTRSCDERYTFMSQWQQVADYGLGRRDFTTHPYVGGRNRQLPIYDGTFQEACDALVAALQAMVFNQAAQWAHVVPEDASLMKEPGVEEYFNEVTAATFKIWNHPEAVFSGAVTECLNDWVAFGNCCMYIDKDDTGIFFQAMPLREMVIDTNSRGVVDTFFRRFELTAKQAVEKFGDDAGNTAQNSFDAKKFDKPIEYIHAVFPKNLIPTRQPPNRSHTYSSIYVNLTDNEITSFRGYHECPFAYARFSTDPGENYGRGPGTNAINDSKMLNRMRKTRISTAEKATDPVLLQADDGVMGSVRTHPGARIIIRDTGSSRVPPVSFLENRARFDISDIAFEQTREQVRAHFFHELLKTFDDPRMTATQVLELSARTAQRVGPPTLRLQSELGERIVSRTVGLASRSRGLFPEKPEVLRGKKLRTDYVTPAQKSQLVANAQSVMTTVGTAIQWAQADMKLLDNIDFDKSVRVLARALGDSGEIMRDEPSVRNIREARARAVEEQHRMNQMKDASEIARNTEGTAAGAALSGGGMGGDQL